MRTSGLWEGWPVALCPQDTRKSSRPSPGQGTEQNSPGASTPRPSLSLSQTAFCTQGSTPGRPLPAQGSEFPSRLGQRKHQTQRGPGPGPGPPFLQTGAITAHHQLPEGGSGFQWGVAGRKQGRKLGVLQLGRLQRPLGPVPCLQAFPKPSENTARAVVAHPRWQMPRSRPLQGQEEREG